MVAQPNSVTLGIPDVERPAGAVDDWHAEALELALSVYEGTLLIVSHDRHFLDQCADRILWIEDGTWRLTEGGYREAFAARQRERERRGRPKVVSQAPVIESAPPKPKPSALGRLKTEDLEARIMKCEERIADLNRKYADPEVFRDADELRKVRDAMRSAQDELRELEIEYGLRS